MGDDRVKQLEMLLPDELRKVAGYIKEQLPTEWGFMVFLFEQNVDNGACLYISDSERESVIESMKSFIKKYEEEKNANRPAKTALKQYDTTNEMKADAIGEFYVACQQNCPECTDLDEADDECVICGGEGTFDHYVPIPWTTMKDIYKRMHEKRVEEMERSNG